MGEERGGKKWSFRTNYWMINFVKWKFIFSSCFVVRAHRRHTHTVNDTYSTHIQANIKMIYSQILILGINIAYTLRHMENHYAAKSRIRAKHKQNKQAKRSEWRKKRESVNECKHKSYSVFSWLACFFSTSSCCRFLVFSFFCFAVTRCNRCAQYLSIGMLRKLCFLLLKKIMFLFIFSQFQL